MKKTKSKKKEGMKEKIAKLKRENQKLREDIALGPKKTQGYSVRYSREI
ncbi:MAG: hypothetical protein ACP5NZ_00595 [Nanobdellota archaeon]